MSGFTPIFNKRRDFLKKTFSLMLLSAFQPFQAFAKNTQSNQKMIQVIKKTEQFNDVIFGGKFYANKPVFNGQANVKPYSNIFYWSNSYVNNTCEFGLHPHEGFEIMTFIFEGTVEHYDTLTKVWTPLKAGDFQIIQSNSGIRHQERLSKDSRAFQIWFDPNFYQTVKMQPAYADYRGEDFKPTNNNGVSTLTYVGADSHAKVLTPNLVIKKLSFDKPTRLSLPLDEDCSYTFYVLKGQGLADNQNIQQDDAIRIANANALDIDFQGELFYIQTPTFPDYRPVWG